MRDSFHKMVGAAVLVAITASACKDMHSIHMLLETKDSKGPILTNPLTQYQTLPTYLITQVSDWRPAFT